MFSKVQKVLCGLIFLAAFSPATAHADDEIRIDLPAGGQLKVRNDFGDVSAEVWNQKFVAVSAIIGGDGSTRLTRSPIIIDNRGSLISISVVRRPIDPVVPVHLRIKIPARCRYRCTVDARNGQIVSRRNDGGRKPTVSNTARKWWQQSRDSDRERRDTFSLCVGSAALERINSLNNLN